MKKEILIAKWHDATSEAAMVMWTPKSDDTLYVGGLSLEQKECLEMEFLKPNNEADKYLAEKYGEYHNDNVVAPHTIRFEKEDDDTFTLEAYWG